MRLWKHLEREVGPVVELSESGLSIEAMASAMREAASGKVSSVVCGGEARLEFCLQPRAGITQSTPIDEKALRGAERLVPV